MTSRQPTGMPIGTDCLVVQPIAEAGLDMLREAGLSVHVAADTRIETLRPHLAVARAVITRNHGLSAAEIDAAPDLEVVVSHGTGVDSIDRAAASARGIPVVSTPGANSQAVAEHAMALVLASAKSVLEADRSVRTGDAEFRFRQKTVELSGRVLGLVGFGRIARRVARLGQAFGMRVTATSRHADPRGVERAGVRFEPSLNALLSRSDVISLHTVPTPGIVLDAARLALLRPHAILVNTARGALIDEDALAAALRAGRIQAAALDVVRDEPLPLDSPLIGCPRLLLTPHIGGSAQEALERTAREAAARAISALGVADAVQSPDASDSPRAARDRDAL